MESLEVAESEILKTMPAGAIVVEKKSGNIVFVNDRFIELMGFNPKGSSFKEYALNMVRARKLEGGPYLFEQLPLTKALLYGEVTANQEIVLQKPDKTDRIIRVNAKPLSNDKGEIIGAIATFEDITECNKAEQALRESEEEYRSLFDNMADGLACCQIILSDEGKPIDFVYLKVNEAFEKITCLKRETVVGKKVNDAIPGTKEAHPELMEIYGRVALTGKTENFEIFFKPLALWLHISAYSIEKGYFVAIFHDISERKKAEEELKESEQLYRTLFENTDDAFQLLKPLYDEAGNSRDLLLLKVNKAYERQTGLKAVDVVGKTVTEYLPNLEPFWISTYSNVAKTGKSTHIENYNQSTNRWYDVYAFLFAKDQVGALFRDVTQRKKAEEALKKSEARYRSLFSNIGEAFGLHEMLFDSQGAPTDYRFLDVNTGFEKQTGLRASEIIGKTVCEVLPDLEPFWIETYGKVVTTGEPVRFENYNRSLKRYFEVYAFRPVEGRFATIFTDVTERKKAEEDLRESEERLKIYLEGSPVAIFVANTDGRFLYANEAAGKLLGYSNKEFLKMSVFDVTFEDELNVNLERFNKLRKTGKARGESRFKRKDGSPVFVFFNATTLPDGNIIANCEDITEGKKLERQVQDNERMAAIGQTAGMVGHDLRNPLQSITGEVYLAKSELNSLPDSETKICLQESIQAIEDQISYMDKIVSDLQTFVKPVDAKIDIVNLSPVITALLAQTDFPKNIQASLQVEDKLIANADVQLLKRVLINLVTNAVQAMPEGGELTIRAQAKDKKVQITVEDTGTGISEEIKPKIFTPLFTTKSKGQGFGLAVCKRVIEAQGGTIDFESQVGKGTKFIIELPA